MANILPDPNQGAAPQPAWIPVGAAHQTSAGDAAARDAALLKAAAQQAELRRKALADPGIARALWNQELAMRGGGPLQSPGSEGGGAGSGSKLEEEARKGAAALAQLTQAAGVAFGTGAGAITSLGAAAGEMSSWPTLQASVKGVAIELGQSFLPVMDSTSLALQDVERWLETVSPSTKQWTANLLISGTAAAGSAYAAMQLVAAYRAIRAAATLANLAMIATPVGAIVTAATAVGGLAAYWALTARNARDAAQAQGEAGRAGEVGTPEGRSTLTTGEIGKLPKSVQEDIDKARAAGDVGKVREVIAGELKEAKEALEKRVEEGNLRSIGTSGVDVEEERRMRESMARRPAPVYDEEHRRTMRESMEGRRELTAEDVKLHRKPEEATGERVDRGILRFSPEDLAESRRLVAEGRAAGKYKTDEEQRAAERRYNERFTRARVDMDSSDVASSREREEKIAEAKARLRAAEVAARKTGADDPGLVRDYHLPQARIGETQSFSDAVQIKALQMQDKTAENQAKQIGALGDIKTELVGMRSDIAALKGVLPSASYGRWGRADEDPGGRD